MSGSGLFTTFYDQLKGIRDYHRRFPSHPAMQTYEQTLLSEVLDNSEDLGFTGEEAEGRYVDMHELHESFLNLRGVERIDYKKYLSKASDLFSVPKATASTAGYGRYVAKLHEYWVGFIRRTQVDYPSALICA